MDQKPDLFLTLETKISELTQYIDRLQGFLSHINQSCFDKEDHEFVGVKLEQAIQVREGLQRTLQHKKEIYENQVRVMEQQLNVRQQQLEGFSGAKDLFNAFPDVLAYFAKKQTRLQESLASIRAKLQEQ